MTFLLSMTCVLLFMVLIELGRILSPGKEIDRRRC